MPITVGSAWWSRLALVALLAVLLPLSASRVPDDGWVAGISEPADQGDALSTPAWSDAVGLSVDLPALPRMRLARPPIMDDRDVPTWRGLAPNDRAPPRA